MLKKILITAISFTFLIVAKQTKAQGCSDAGFCSIKYNPNDKGVTTKNSLKFGNVIGIGEAGILINTTSIAYNYIINNKVNWDIKLNTNYASGKLANNFNIGDIITNVSFKVYDNEIGSAIHIAGGAKIPLTQGNDKSNGKALPMAYQASLGTWDALFGVSIVKNKWEFTNAYQIPFINNNKNTFFKELSTTTDFPTTNKFVRKADALLRAAYNIKKKNWLIKPNILTIVHLGEDVYKDLLGKKQFITGSNGVTLNANVIANYTFNKKNSIEFSLASPLIVREVRPDGLTRSVTFGVEYKFTF